MIAPAYRLEHSRSFGQVHLRLVGSGEDLVFSGDSGADAVAKLRRFLRPSPSNPAVPERTSHADREAF